MAGLLDTPRRLGLLNQPVTFASMYPGAMQGGQSLSAYDPTLRDRAAVAMQEWGVSPHVVSGLLGSRGLGLGTGPGPGGTGLADLTTIPAIPFYLDEASRAREAGDIAGQAMDTIAALPLVGQAGKALRGLPMDAASRVVRADEGGFYRKMPLYHGADKSFTGFDLSKGGATTGAAPGQQGVWLALEPETADEFAKMASGKSGGNEQIYPLVHRADKPAVIHLDGDEKNLEIAATLDDAFAQGYDAVLFRNYTTPGGAKSRSILVVKDPSQLRSPVAAFDPARRGSSDLLAGATGLAAVGGAAAAVAGSGDEATAAPAGYTTGSRF